MIVSGGGVVEVVCAAASVLVVAKEVSPAIVVSDLRTLPAGLCLSAWRTSKATPVAMRM
jgi:hypothetical protein